MLKDPKWGGPSVPGLISWLETKDPTMTYNFYNTDGDCLLCRYLNEVHGVPVNETMHAYQGLFGEDGEAMSRRTRIACGAGHGEKGETYGQALKRAYLELEAVNV